MEINAKKELLAAQQKLEQDKVNAQKELLEVQMKIEEAKRAQAEANAQAGNYQGGNNGHSKKAKPPSLSPYKGGIDDIDAYTEV